MTTRTFSADELLESEESHFSRLDPETSGRFHQKEEVRPTKSHRALEWTLFAIFGALLTLVGLALYASYSPEFREVPNTVAAGIQADRVNILLIGVGGDEHPGGDRDLADSIIVASVKPSTGQVALLSVPRDSYVKVGRYGKHRLNKAHQIGNQSGYPGAGPALLMNTVGEMLEQEIHAFVRVDFAAFEKIIDDLGGVDINVQRGFYDYLFHDSFRAGMQHMNGERALRFARYRYIAGPEGDNYARELRQQQLLAAIHAKLQQRSVDDVLPLMRTAKTLNAYTDTNLTTSQMLWFYRRFRNITPEQVRHISLKPYMQTFELRSITEAGEAVRPRGGNFEEIRRMSASVFTDTPRGGDRIAQVPATQPTAVSIDRQETKRQAVALTK